MDGGGGGVQSRASSAPSSRIIREQQPKWPARDENNLYFIDAADHKVAPNCPFLHPEERKERGLKRDPLTTA
jgi:hypothetical protein